MKRQRSVLDQPQNPAPWKKNKYMGAGGMAVEIVPPPVKLSAVQRKQVKRIINADREKKWLIQTGNLIAVSVAAAAADVTPVPQGNTEITRVGNEVEARSFHLKYTVKAADTTQQIRVLVVQYKADNNSAPFSGAELFYNGPSGVVDWNSEQNEDYKQQYKILYDRLHNLYLTNDTFQQSVSTFITIPSKKVHFNLGATTGENHIYIAYISDSAVATHPTLTYSTKFVYTDA